MTSDLKQTEEPYSAELQVGNKHVNSLSAGFYCKRKREKREQKQEREGNQLSQVKQLAFFSSYLTLQ